MLEVFWGKKSGVGYVGGGRREAGEWLVGAMSVFLASLVIG